MAKIDMPTSSLNKTPGQQPKKKLEKVTTGKVTVRQQTDIQKVASAFLAEDLATVKERIINDYAIPMLKNGIWSIFSSALSLMIFGEDKSRSQSSNYVRGSSNSYDRYYANPNRSQPANQRVIPNWQNLISDSRADMEEILDQMWEAIREYGQVSIGDLYDLAGMTCNFTDNNSMIFDESCSLWEKDSMLNAMTIRNVESAANRKLRTNGHLFLNEVIDMLDPYGKGCHRTAVGQVAGWIYDPKDETKQNCVSLGTHCYVPGNEALNDFINGDERSVILHFNCDGPIIDKI